MEDLQNYLEQVKKELRERLRVDPILYNAFKLGMEHGMYREEELSIAALALSKQNEILVAQLEYVFRYIALSTEQMAELERIKARYD